MAEGTETIKICLEDDASDAANSAAAALERLAKSQDTQAKAGIGGVEGEKQSTAFKRLREMGTQAGSALAGAFESVQNRMINAVTATNRLSSALQLAQNRARELKSAEASDLAAAMGHANRTPTALQSSPKEIDWAGALAEASNKSGSALKAAATNALELATAEATAVTNAQKLATVYDLVAKRAAAAAKAEAKVHSEQETRANQIPTALKQSGPGPASSFQKLIGEVEGIFGKRAAGATAEAGQSLAGLADKYEKLGPIAQSVIKGGASIAVGAAALAAAAALAIVAFAVKGAIAIGKVSLEESELKKSAVGALDRLSAGNGAAEYKVALKLSADLNLDEEDAVAQVKSLLQAKIDRATIPLVITAAADLRIAKGDEAASALTKGIAKISNKGKFDSEAINSLAEAGVNAADVYAALAKKGESVASVMARVKTNQVGAAEGIKAVLAAVEKTSGGLAKASGQTIAGLASSIQKSFLHLFDDVDTGPLKETLKTIKALFDGDKGDKLKASVTSLGNAIFDVFRTMNTPEGKKALSEGFDKAAQAASDAAVVVRAFDRAITSASNNGGFSVLGAAVDAILEPLKMAADFVKVLDLLKGGDGSGNDRPAGAGGDKAPIVAPPIDTSKTALDAATGGQVAGENLASGFTAGILSGTNGAVNAAIDMARKALDGVASPAGQDSHSPSKKAAKLGGHFTSGYAIQIAAGGADAKQAGAALAMKAIGGTAAQQGANDVGPLASPSGGAVAGGGVTFNITVSGTGTPEQNKKAGQEIGDAAYAAWSMHFGHKMRDMKRAAG
jgi:hypothetical protein